MEGVIKIKKILFIILTNLLMPTLLVKASTFYTNDNGVEMSQSQYEKIVATYGENYVKIVNKDNFDNIISGKMKLVSSDTAYFVVNTKNINGVISSTNKKVTKEEYDNFDSVKLDPKATGFKEYETNAKRLEFYFNAATDNSGNLIAQLELYCFWKTMPIVRSYDISAIRWTTTANLKFNVLNVIGEQNYKINNTRGRVNYSNGGTNSKKFSNAAGISMNILDDATSDLYTVIYINGTLTGKGTMSAYGTYQHAVRYLSLEESQSYTISASGLGGVLNHSYASSHDGMQGLMVSYTK